jgi:hypothetical protein
MLGSGCDNITALLVNRYVSFIYTHHSPYDITDIEHSGILAVSAVYWHHHVQPTQQILLLKLQHFLSKMKIFECISTPTYVVV